MGCTRTWDMPGPPTACGTTLGASYASTAKECPQHPGGFGACMFNSCHESTKHGSRRLPGCLGAVGASFIMVTRAATTLWTCPALGKPRGPSKAKGFYLRSDPRSNCCIQVSPLGSSDSEAAVPHLSPPSCGHETCPCSAAALPKERPPSSTVR